MIMIMAYKSCHLMQIVCKTDFQNQNHLNLAQVHHTREEERTEKNIEDDDDDVTRYRMKCATHMHTFSLRMRTIEIFIIYIPIYIFMNK